MGRPWVRAALALVGTVALGGCLLLPGKFDSTMDVRKDGRFSFAYKGEIQMLGLTEMIEKAGKSASEEAEPFAAKCFKDSAFGTSLDVSALPRRGALQRAAWQTVQDDDFVKNPPGAAAEEPMVEDDEPIERPCTAEEIAEQKKDWDEARRKKAETDASARQMMARLFGGIDPGDPQSIDKFAERIARIEGWRSVKHLGKGVFLVDYAISGRLDRDFIFPSIPGYGLGGPFVHVERWKSGEVKVRAPGFADNGGMSAMSGLDLPGGGLGGMSAGAGDKDGPGIRPVEGRFTLTTDAGVRTNNTEAGPTEKGQEATMAWKVDATSKTTPEALLRLSPAP